MSRKNNLGTIGSQSRKTGVKSSARGADSVKIKQKAKRSLADYVSEFYPDTDHDMIIEMESIHWLNIESPLFFSYLQEIMNAILDPENIPLDILTEISAAKSYDELEWNWPNRKDFEKVYYDEIESQFIEVMGTERGVNCPKCKKDNWLYNTKQKRSADEGISGEYKCTTTGCSYRITEQT
jgi:DNA-directed RNA polymerase subunit M/transcription elongation factor TFIIS